MHRAMWPLCLAIIGACGSDSQPTTPGNEQPTQPIPPSTDTLPLRTLAAAKGRPTAQLQTQAQNYGDVLSTCLQYPACDLVVMWGFTDKESWVPSAFPGCGAALVFDAAYQAKPA
jgi:hypothetical protein